MAFIISHAKNTDSIIISSVGYESINAALANEISFKLLLFYELIKKKVIFCMSEDAFV